MGLLDRAADIEDLKKMARRRTPAFLFDAMEQGGGTGDAVQRNVDDFKRYVFVPKALVDVRAVETRRTVFGREYALPFGISAVGLAGIYRRFTDEAFAQAARDLNIPFLLSGAGTTGIDQIIRIAPEHIWFQLYFSKNLDITDRMIGRAADLGVKTLVLTVDYPVTHRSLPAMRSGVSLAAGVPLGRWPALVWDVLRHPAWAKDYVMQGGHPAIGSWAPYAPPGSSPKDVARFLGANWPGNPTWTEIERVREIWKGKLVIKGLVDADDAARALAAGADAVTVSNHGGNKLDLMPSSISRLVPIKRAVGDKIPVFFDGGIRRGSDVLVASRMGADFCFIGRSALYGALAGGAPGVRKAADILTAELKNAMAMIGAPTLAEAPEPVQSGA